MSSTNWEDLSKQQLISKLAGYKSHIKKLEEEAELLADKPTRFLIHELKTELAHQRKLVYQKTKDAEKALERLGQEHPDVKDVSEQLARAIKRNTTLEGHRSDHEEYVHKLKRDILELEDKVDELRLEVSNLESENKDIKEAFVKAKEQKPEPVKPFEPPSKDEIRAAFQLDVTVQQLRRWKRREMGPQPPYEDLESWYSWVEANA